MAFSDASSTAETDFVGASYSMPFSIRARSPDLSVSLSSSYLSQSDTAATNSTVSGMGDVSIYASYALNDWSSINGKHKFATSDESLGFSTGEDDNEASADFYYMYSYTTTLFSTVGYKWVGKGTRSDRQNAGFVSLGASYAVNRDFNLAGSIDYNQSSYTVTDDVIALTVFGSHKTSKAFDLGWFVSKDSTDIYAVGTSINYSF